MKDKIIKRWQGPGGFAEVLRIATPLVLSTSAHTVQMFIDRMFLTWHSSEAMAAAMPAGITAFVIVSFFMGLVSYANTFVAQYTGAGRPHRVGPAVWQGIYLSLAAAALVLPMIWSAKHIFRLMDHGPVVQQYEVTYFRIMCVGVGPVLICSAISCFFTGRGKTWTVFKINLVATILNIVLDYGLILGHFGLPRWGIAGAGWATVTANIIAMLLYIVLFFRKRYRRRYATWRGSRPDIDLFRRMMRYGLPNGIQFMLDILAFDLFIAFVGRINPVTLAANTMTFSINMLSFLPMMGFGIAVTTMVGQSLGSNKPDLAKRCTWSAFYITFGYMSLVALGYWFYPEIFLFPFSIRAHPQEFAQIEPLVKNLLHFVALYCIFDTGNIIFAAALKGAGDTRFVMMVLVSFSWTLMVLPCYLAVKFSWGAGKGLYVAWGFVTVYVCVVAVVFLARFLQGKWETMRVIEQVAPTIPYVVAEVPASEAEVN